MTIKAKTKTVALAVATCAMLAVPGVAIAAENKVAIVRHANTPPGLILQGVTVPAGAKMLYLSGQLAAPIDPAAKTPPAQLTIADFGDTKTQTISVFTKIKTILAAQGYAMSDIVKLTVFVAGDPKLGGKMDFAGMNDAFKMFFGTAENPNTVARSTVQVAALAGPAFLVEIEATAAK
ncbi:RidA family protein [Sphingomonas sp. OK281]|uniref:RidA family protein n=1 Tax=Sphingomonas sp. OK281 TaxID=1881067 RepID=UPI0008E2F9A9|nr:RidA family protein [Sphingomonas sp. OK281]SFN77844.1 Enamine deaminase RidA, house cleaning of reactive enamine intermediates, YjgF/YER057c/UK114 family [Sphingomonas sp. OK281]